MCACLWTRTCGHVNTEITHTGTHACMPARHRFACNRHVHITAGPSFLPWVPMAFGCVHLAFLNSCSSVFTVFSILSWLAVHGLYLFFNLWSLSCHQFTLFFHCREPSIMTWLVVRSGRTRGNMSALNVDESILRTAKSSERKRTGNSHRPCWAVGLGEGNPCDRTRSRAGTARSQCPACVPLPTGPQPPPQLSWKPQEFFSWSYSISKLFYLKACQRTLSLVTWVCWCLGSRKNCS